MNNNTPPILVINLDRDTKRLEHAKRQIEKTGRPWERVKAVDGLTLSAEEHAMVDQKKAKKLRKRTMTDGEIGCMLSHRKAWQYIANGRYSWGMVAEDDLIIRQPKLLNNIIDSLYKVNTWSAANFTRPTNRKRTLFCINHRKAIPLGDNCYIANYYNALHCTCFYALTTSYAKELLAFTSTFSIPVDTLLWNASYSKRFPQILYYQKNKNIQPIVEVDDASPSSIDNLYTNNRSDNKYYRTTQYHKKKIWLKRHPLYQKIHSYCKKFFMVLFFPIFLGNALFFWLIFSREWSDKNKISYLKVGKQPNSFQKRMIYIKALKAKSTF